MTGAPSCADLNRDTDDHPERVGVFADARPDCACENESLSEHSPGLIANEETIARMVCVPEHVHPKRAQLNTSFFSYAFSRGVSVQRLEVSADAELLGCVQGLLSSRVDRQWLGYVIAPASAIRAIQGGDSPAQAFCVADAALVENRAHAEIHCAHHSIPEADRLERRAELMKLFNASGIQHRRSLRDGKIWDALSSEMRARPVPKQWEALV